MAPIARGFGGRRRDAVDPIAAPAGSLLRGWLPVLSAGPTPRTQLGRLEALDQGAGDEARSWTWDEFMALPAEDATVDIHGVTQCSTLDTIWSASRRRPTA